MNVFSGEVIERTEFLDIEVGRPPGSQFIKNVAARRLANGDEGGARSHGARVT